MPTCRLISLTFREPPRSTPITARRVGSARTASFVAQSGEVCTGFIWVSRLKDLKLSIALKQSCVHMSPRSAAAPRTQPPAGHGQRGERKSEENHGGGRHQGCDGETKVRPDHAGQGFGVPRRQEKRQ